jgi:hypothetical protein
LFGDWGKRLGTIGEVASYCYRLVFVDTESKTATELWRS